MKWFQVLIFAITYLILFSTFAAQASEKSRDISHLITQEKFAKDIAEYGKGVVKSLTGSDCDRDGKMDDNATCNRVYLKLWLKYKR